MSRRAGPARPLLDAALDVVHAQLALGHAEREADGARFVRNPAFPAVYDANFVWGVRAATPEAIERVLARAETEYEGLGHRAFRLDPRTPPGVAARLALLGYERSDALVLLLEGAFPDRPGPAPCEIRPAASEADWAAYTAMRSDDFAESFARREPGKPVDRSIGEGLAGSNRAKAPPQRQWLAVAGGEPCGFVASWEGTEGVGQVEDLFVRPSHRGRGIARALLAHAVADARRHGAGPVAIVADPTDTPMRLYARLGFAPLAVCSLYVLRRGRC